MANISQINGSLINAATASLATSASFATSASRAISSSQAVSSSWAVASSTALSATSASFATNALTANSATSAISASTGLMTTNANHFLVYVPDNNLTPTAEALGTVGTLTYNPSTSLLTVPKISGSQITGSILTTGSFEITGSLRGNIVSQSIASNTSSFNLETGNYYTLTLASNATTHITFTNIKPGQSANIRITQGAAGGASAGKVSFPSAVKQPSGSSYTGSAVANAIDIVSVVTFDTTSVYLNSVRNLI